MRFPTKLKERGAQATAGILVAVGIFYFGFATGTKQRPAEPTPQDQIVSADFSLFWDAIDIVKRKYVDIKNVQDTDFVYGAIRGAIGSLDDPYSDFLKPDDAKKFEQDLQGSFGGVGAEIGSRNNQLVIIAPLKGNPAEAAGLKAGDRILQINDTIVTTDLSVDAAVKLIRGPEGTPVKLLILRDGWKEAKEFSVTRRTVILPTLDWEMKPGNIFYVRLHNFNANVPSLFYQASLSALTNGVSGVVLDMRNNPGGFLDVATNLAGWFLKKGDVVVTERFASGAEQKLRASGNSAFMNVPIVVLVNGGSASASEIIAGALRDNRGSTLIGEKTFGKGSVQEVENLKDGSTVKISIAEWRTPAGTVINKKGLSADIEIKPKDDAKNDEQLEKALAVITEKINAGVK